MAPIAFWRSHSCRVNCSRICALSRRVRSTLVRNPLTIIEVGPLRIDTVRHEVTHDNITIRLTPTESHLLHLLAVNANDICTLDQIVTHVWGFGEAGDKYLVKAHIRHLREKIEPVPSKPRFIISSPGIGYMYMLKRPTVEGSLITQEVQTVEIFPSRLQWEREVNGSLAE